MPTPFKIRNPKSEVRRGEWTAHTDTPKRSVFGNYRADDARSSGRESAPSDQSRLTPAAATNQATLQTAIDLALARSFIHRFLAKAYEDPTPESWQWLCAPATQESLHGAWSVLGGAGNLPAPFGDPPNGTGRTFDRIENTRFSFRAHVLPSGGSPDGTGGSPVLPTGAPAATSPPDAFESFLDAYLAAFGHAARGSCPLNEIEYGDIKADPLFQPHRLADLAAFYRAFGLEVAADAGERHDHLCLELEFMCVLALQEAYALEHQFDGGQLAQCRDAQKKFLREHLGRWTPAFARRLAAATNNPALRALAEFTSAFVESECARFGVTCGSEELALRPVDEAADRACDSCGINNLPPGALAAA